MVSAKLNTLTHLKRYVNTRTLLLTYKTAILPIKEYANITHSLLTKSLNKKLQRLQNRALKLVYNSTFPHEQGTPQTEELRIKAKIAPIKQRAEKQLLCLMYKRSRNPSTYPQLSNEESDVNTRSSRKIRFAIPRPSCKRFKHFPH